MVLLFSTAVIYKVIMCDTLCLCMNLSYLQWYINVLFFSAKSFSNL
jgi:hypothetical protein